MKKFSALFILAGLLLVNCGVKRRQPLRKNVRPARVTRSDTDSKKAEKTIEVKDHFNYIPVESPEDYISQFRDVAQREMREFGIPASITLAQGLLESGYGKGELTRKTNNHFGIKCHTGWQGESMNYDDDLKGECFRKYNHPMESFRDHSLFLTTRSRYAALFELEKLDYKAWAYGLKSAGYATDPKYPQKLITIIERYNLNSIDTAVLGLPAKSSLASESAVTSVSGTHQVIAGDTLYSLSRRYQMSVEELMRLNKLDSTNLSIGQLLKVQNHNTSN